MVYKNRALSAVHGAEADELLDLLNKGISVQYHRKEWFGLYYIMLLIITLLR